MLADRKRTNDNKRNIGMCCKDTYVKSIARGTEGLMRTTGTLCDAERNGVIKKGIISHGLSGQEGLFRCSQRISARFADQ